MREVVGAAEVTMSHFYKICSIIAYQELKMFKKMCRLLRHSIRSQIIRDDFL